MFIDFIVNCANLAFPVKRVMNKSSQPKINWFSNELKTQRDNLSFLKQYMKQHDCSDTRKLYKASRNNYRQELKRAKVVANDRYLKIKNYSPKSIWDTVRQNSNISSRLENAGNINLTPEHFNNYFTSIAEQIINGLSSSDLSAEDYVADFSCDLSGIECKLDFTEVTIIELRDVMMSLKNRDCKDYYGLNVRMIRCITHIVVYPLLKLINLCIRQSRYPSVLKYTRVIPVYKKGSRNELTNYRPISIVTVFSKIFEILIKRRIAEHYDSCGLFNINQFGFRSSLSTTEAIAKLIHIINTGFENGMYTGALFCDLSKAFDCVSIDLLIMKLKYYGFSTGSVALIASYLTDRHQIVEINGVKSTLKRLSCGVPQGSVLGPLLFLIYINDLRIKDSTSEIILFADDTTVVEQAERVCILKDRLVEAESKVKDWFCANNLSLNVSKTDYLVFTMKQFSDETMSDTVRFLGVQLDSKLSWNQHIDYLADKLASAVYAIRNLSEVVSESVSKVVYYSYFQSRIMYALLIWGHSPKLKRIFGLQRKAIRALSRVHYREDCRDLFIGKGLLTVPCLYIFQCLLYMRENLDQYTTHENIHCHLTRNRTNIYTEYHRIHRTKTAYTFYGPKVFNVLPGTVKSLPINSFKKIIKCYLIHKCFYSMDDYLNNDFSDLLLNL